MANLTVKELLALNDQLNFEKTLCCKYQSATQECTDSQVKQQFQTLADQHKQNYNCLLNHLN